MQRVAGDIQQINSIPQLKQRLNVIVFKLQYPLKADELKPVSGVSETNTMFNRTLTS